jgi:peptide-methionine (S)-S-oxide reductase
MRTLAPLALLLAAGAAGLGATPAPRAARADTAVFAGGCFWGIEGVFEHVRGVISAVAGFSGGTVASPSYEEVSTGTTGHAESVEVIFDPSQVSYEELLRVFFAVHDPTELDRQGPDEGTQYRSAIFYRDPAQKAAAEAYVAELTRTKAFSAPIVTQITRFGAFYRAEAYHQHYMALHPYQPYIVINDAPKLALLKRRFAPLYRDN